MLSTMGDAPLTTTAILRYAERIFPGSEVGTYDGERIERRSLGDVALAARRLAAGLRELGIEPGDRVATLCWNHASHLEAYYGVPGLGAVLHTLNLRLPPEQLLEIIEHAGDRFLIVDARLTELLAPVAERVAETVERVIVIGEEAAPVFPGALRYAELAGEERGFEWPEVDERSAAVMCYTTGTTGAPKGVAYSHRSTYLQSLAICSGNAYMLSEADRVLVLVPMFHANAWGLPYACWLTGADMLLPQEHVQGSHLARLIESERISFAAGVPTVLDELLRTARRDGRDLSSLRLLISGGAAVPASLIERWRDEAGVELLQGWGMTETNPLCALARPPRGTPEEEQMRWRSRTGRPIHGVELRIAAEDGSELPWDDEAVGEIQVRGPWVTASYFRDAAPEKFHEGWLRTGDVGRVSPDGYVQITDRTKDVIKSGGEWISSIELENHVMGHPSVREAAVIGVADERWGERPLVCFVPEEGTEVEIEALRGHVEEALPRWWVPERWASLPEIPKTSVGKFDKKALRDAYGRGDLDVERPGGAQ